jgi:hypothetical protein
VTTPRRAPASPGLVRGADHPLAVRAAARLELEQRRALARYGVHGDPWAFVRDCVWTRDEATGMVRRYPDRAYAELLVRRWQTCALLAVPKSRRMVVTWLFVAVNYWLARFRPASKVAFMARKLGRSETEGSCELVRRARFIHEHVPATVLPRLEAEYQIGMLRFPNGSEIVALGEGPDQARQHTFTSVLADEVAFWEQAYETWVALRPTIEGGGRITAVSSAAPGFFRDLVHDRLG